MTIQIEFSLQQSKTSIYHSYISIRFRWKEVQQKCMHQHSLEVAHKRNTKDIFLFTFLLAFWSHFIVACSLRACNWALAHLHFPNNICIICVIRTVFLISDIYKNTYLYWLQFLCFQYISHHHSSFLSPKLGNVLKQVVILGPWGLWSSIDWICSRLILQYHGMDLLCVKYGTTCLNIPLWWEANLL